MDASAIPQEMRESHTELDTEGHCHGNKIYTSIEKPPSNFFYQPLYICIFPYLYHYLSLYSVYILIYIYIYTHIYVLHIRDLPLPVAA